MIEVRPVTAPETLPLRAQVLRPGHTPDEKWFMGGMPPEARHFAAFDGADIVGVAFVVPMEAPFAPGERAWMLRGMAVDPARQNQGIGRAVVEAILVEARREEVEILWFNARRVAVGFYARLGFETWGEEFEIPGVGPHTLMFARL